ncbi:hypothetical protein KDA_76160 [Dictyobacter alpinus]|uniref:CHRD domain-containing protein n=1 Tax=Dictyobacter alpinus TaxID=2014873 RepID=A0A402BLC4_9CHLR|nr:CHRD domain-containing protein [Dictyobacter alpinus]GCE32132.1 hypothetical protein KDA_76160 [Dictyobacter alpinus]
MQIRTKKTLIALWAALAFMLALTACGSPFSTTSAVQNVKTATSGKTATAVLLHSPVGTADVVWDPQQQTLTVTMQVSGLAPNSPHPLHIHLGVCDDPGTMLYMLPNLQANASGQASINAIIKGVAHLPKSGWLINVHNGPTMAAQDNQNIAIACATLTMKEATTKAPLKEHVELGGTTAANESVSGTANFSVDTTSTLSVSVKVHGLEPGSHHAVHVHAGNCNRQGKMLYPLIDLVADANGDANSSATFSGVDAIPASGWYVNVHFAKLITDQKGQIISQVFNPIACGNVVLS